MQLEGERLKQEQETQDRRVKELEMQVEDGRRAERLAGNPDWQWFVGQIVTPVEIWDKEKINYYDTILKTAITRDQKDSAIDQIRQLNLTFESVRNVMNFTSGKIDLAASAKEELTKIQEEKNDRSKQPQPGS